MVIRVKTIREEFESGADGGYIYGEIQRQKKFPVYVDLGTEEYIPSAKDDTKTEYRLFTGCNAFVAESDEQLDREEYISSSLNVTVIIYC
jgi:hypothetical protein